MNQKDLIKYGLIALGAYLIYRYIQDHGGIEGILGTPATTPPPGTTATTISTPLATSVPGKTIPPTPQAPANHPVSPATPPTPATPPAPSVLVSQQMLKAAGTNNLNMDQWSYFYTQVTGLGSPVDPGAIDPSVYAGAGIEDRTTPTDIGTWLAIMQNQAPQLGLTGLGARYTPAWLM